MFTEAKDDGGCGDNWTTGAISRAKLQSNHHHQETNIQFFTGRMPFLSPNQQCQSIEEKRWRKTTTKFNYRLLRHTKHINEYIRFLLHRCGIESVNGMCWEYIHICLHNKQSQSVFTFTQPLYNNSINQSIKFIISVAHCRLDFTINIRKNTSAMLNVNTTKITVVDETRECLSRLMLLTYSVW